MGALSGRDFRMESPFLLAMLTRERHDHSTSTQRRHGAKLLPGSFVWREVDAACFDALGCYRVRHLAVSSCRRLTPATPRNVVVQHAGPVR